MEAKGAWMQEVPGWRGTGWRLDGGERTWLDGEGLDGGERGLDGGGAWEGGWMVEGAGRRVAG